jgi:hypothetical protein
MHARDHEVETVQHGVGVIERAVAEDVEPSPPAWRECVFQMLPALDPRSTATTQ